MNLHEAFGILNEAGKGMTLNQMKVNPDATFNRFSTKGLIVTDDNGIEIKASGKTKEAFEELKSKLSGAFKYLPKEQTASKTGLQLIPIPK